MLNCDDGLLGEKVSYKIIVKKKQKKKYRAFARKKKHIIQKETKNRKLGEGSMWGKMWASEKCTE